MYNKIDWDLEKEKLKELIEKRVPFSKIAKLYGLKSGNNIKNKVIKLGIEIINNKTGEIYSYESPKLICKHCGKEFDDKRKLAGHSTFCEQNPKYLENLERLNENRKNAHSTIKSNTKIDLECRFCGKVCHNSGALSVHEIACERNPDRQKHPNRKGNGGSNAGHIIWNKGKTSLTDERVLKGSSKRKESIKNGSYIPKSTPHTEKTKRVLREKMIHYINTLNSDGLRQHFSEKGCEYIDELNKKFGWNLVHAKNGGEKEICGYFLDGYDEKLNIAFEYDEPYHYKDVYNNILRDRDIQRQKNIINELNCVFYRYNEKLNKLYMV